MYFFKIRFNPESKGSLHMPVMWRREQLAQAPVCWLPGAASVVWRPLAPGQSLPLRKELVTIYYFEFHLMRSVTALSFSLVLRSLFHMKCGQ